MVGATVTSGSRLRYFGTIGGLLVLALFSAPAPSLGQSNAGGATARHPTSVAKSGAPPEKRIIPQRRKRGGPESSPTNEAEATPVEGQSDLIKVLKPGSRQTQKKNDGSRL